MHADSRSVSVRVEPGETAAAVIPIPRRSCANPLNSPTTACLAASGLGISQHAGNHGVSEICHPVHADFEHGRPNPLDGYPAAPDRQRSPQPWLWRRRFARTAARQIGQQL